MWNFEVGVGYKMTLNPRQSRYRNLEGPQRDGPAVLGVLECTPLRKGATNKSTLPPEIQNSVWSFQEMLHRSFFCDREVLTAQSFFSFTASFFDTQCSVEVDILENGLRLLIAHFDVKTLLI